MSVKYFVLNKQMSYLNRITITVVVASGFSDILSHTGILCKYTYETMKTKMARITISNKL